MTLLMEELIYKILYESHPCKCPRSIDDWKERVLKRYAKKPYTIKGQQYEIVEIIDPLQNGYQFTAKAILKMKPNLN